MSSPSKGSESYYIAGCRWFRILPECYENSEERRFRAVEGGGVGDGVGVVAGVVVVEATAAEVAVARVDEEVELDVGGGGEEDPVVAVDGAAIEHLDKHLPVVAVKEPEHAGVGTAIGNGGAKSLQPLATRELDVNAELLAEGERLARVLGVLVVLRRDAGGAPRLARPGDRRAEVGRPMRPGHREDGHHLIDHPRLQQHLEARRAAGAVVRDGDQPVEWRLVRQRAAVEQHAAVERLAHEAAVERVEAPLVDPQGEQGDVRGEGLRRRAGGVGRMEDRHDPGEDPRHVELRGRGRRCHEGDDQDGDEKSGGEEDGTQVRHGRLPFEAARREAGAR